MNAQSSVIIVDNNEVLLNMLRLGLSKEGYRCETTTSSHSALERITESPFDVLITDIVMPGLDGFELTVKAKTLRPDMAVIIMTGFIDDFSYDKAMEAGASDFIKKPFTLSEMKMRLHHVAAQGKLQETSLLDEHTGLFNRKGFIMLAEQQLKLAGRYGKGLFALAAVLNNLTAIQDAHGYHERTQALTDMAALLRTAWRQADVLARVGENEFAVIPAGSGDDDMAAAIEKFQADVERHNRGKESTRKLSVSVGTAYYDPAKPCSADELLARGCKMCGQTAPGKRP